MYRMISRCVAAATVVAVSSTALVALSGTAAQAATDTTRAVSVQLKTGDLTLEHGATLNLLARATSGGRDVDADANPIALQRRIAGGAWQTIRRSDTGEFWQVRAADTARYRVHYLGGTSTAADGSTTTWQPAYSRVVTAKVRHRITWRAFDDGHQVGFRGRVSPKVTKRVSYQTRTGGAWRTIKKFRLTRGHQFKLAMNGANGQKFRLLVPGSRTVRPASLTLKLSTQWGA